MRKIFTFFCAALMSVGMFATTVTWDNGTLSSIYLHGGDSFTKDGVTLTVLDGMIDGRNFMGFSNDASFKFSTSLGNFTKIEITGNINALGGSGWTQTILGAVWTGEANETTFGMSFDNVSQIVFTIGEPTPAKERVIFGVNVPANGKPESIELVGSFMEDGWNNGIVLTVSETGWYVSFDVYANADDEFKIRAAGSWNNEIYVRTETGWTATQNVKFGDVWVDDTYKGDPVKWIELDLSGDNYGWKTVVQSIENIELTEQAQKVVVDGVIYIVRDGKLFNLTGAQVK